MIHNFKSINISNYYLILVYHKLKMIDSLKNSKCWVWFKGSINKGGYWKEGFTCTFDEKPGVLIESPAYVTCRVPNWRVQTKEPENLSRPPMIPENAIWKII